jgi:Family of unknown function (DUF5329)
MKMRWMTSVLMLGFLLASSARADTPANVQREVDFLIGDIGMSGCEFYRNGSWHDSHEAQAHLRDKYTYLSARNMVNTTEDFIEKAGTESSLSGQAYAVRCNGNPAVTSNQWLHDELARYRTK